MYKDPSWYLVTMRFRPHTLPGGPVVAAVLLGTVLDNGFSLFALAHFLLSPLP